MVDLDRGGGASALLFSLDRRLFFCFFYPLAFWYALEVLRGQVGQCFFFSWRLSTRPTFFIIVLSIALVFGGCQAHHLNRFRVSSQQPVELDEFMCTTLSVARSGLPFFDFVKTVCVPSCGRFSCLFRHIFIAPAVLGQFFVSFFPPHQKEGIFFPPLVRF